MLKNAKNLLLMLVTLVTGLVASAAAVAQTTAPTVPDSVSMIQAILDKQAGYGSVIFLLALAGTGIMVGVKWIRRGGKAS